MMKYYISFQEYAANIERPIDHPSTADYEATADSVGLIPNVGDHVQIDPLNKEGAPRYSGRVKSRLFRYLGDTCGVNIVVEDDDSDWGKVIKE